MLFIYRAIWPVHRLILRLNIIRRPQVKHLKCLRFIKCACAAKMNWECGIHDAVWVARRRAGGTAKNRITAGILHVCSVK